MAASWPDGAAFAGSAGSTDRAAARSSAAVRAVAAAHAHVLAGGAVATATTTYGAGFTNSLTSLAEARLARVPLVLIAGAGPDAGPRWWDVDQQAIATNGGDLG